VFYDSLTAHLAHPNWLILNHAVRYRPYDVYSNYPLNVEMVYTFSMLLARGDQIAKLLNLLLGITSALLVFSIASRFTNRRAASIAATVFYLVPSLDILSGLATHDLGMLLFEVASVYALFIWFNQSDKKWLLLSAVLCGFAMGTKYTGLYFLVACLFVLKMRLLFDRKGVLSLTKAVMTFLVAAVLVSSPWFIKNLVYTGNPFYPVLTSIFGMNEYQKAGFNLTSGKAALTPIRFLRLPWDMTFKSQNFGSASQIGPLFLIFLVPFLVTRRVTRDLRYMLMFTAGLFFFWAVTIINTRYFLPGLAFLSIWIGYCCDRYLGKKILAWIIWVVLGASVLFNAGYTLNLTTKLFDPGAVVFHRINKSAYLAQRLDYYPVAAYANKNLPKDAKILFIGEARTYYVKRNYDASSAYDKTIIVEMIKRSKTMDDLLAQLKREGFTDIIYNGREAFRLDERFKYFNWDSPEEKAMFDDFTAEHLKVIFKYDEVYLLHIEY
jgi:hypothetical protein